MNYTYEDIAKMVDHSLLPPTLTDQELESGCHMALEYNCASVCIMPYYLQRCAEILKGSTVAASTTIGFPHGAHTTAIKVAEAQRALDDGCQELDMVTNISKVLSGDWNYVRQDLKAVIDVAIENKLREAMKAGLPQPLSTKDLTNAIGKVKPSTREWFSTARNYALYANQGGIYDDILKFLKL